MLSLTWEGWNVLHIPNGDAHDAAVYEKAVAEAKSQTEKPSIIIMRTTIGCGSGAGIEGQLLTVGLWLKSNGW